MKKIKGIGLEQNRPVLKVVPFSETAVYKKGVFETRVTLLFDNVFASIEPYDFTETMKLYMPLCPVIAINKEEHMLLETIYGQMSDTHKEIYNKNKDIHNQYVMFTCLTIYEKRGVITQIPENRRFVRCNKNVISLLGKVINAPKVTQSTDGRETFKEYIDTNVVCIKAQRNINRNSDRYQKLLAMFGGNREMADIMMGGD